MAVTSVRRSGLTNLIKYDRFTAGNASDFALIESITVGSGGASSVTFSNIPQGFQHLQIRGIARNAETSGFNNVGMTFNGATSTYSGHTLFGNGSSAGSQGYSGLSSINVAHYAASNGLASNIFSALVIDILDYADTSKNTTTRTLTGGDANGSGIVLLTSGAWYSTNAVTSITLGGAAHSQHSSFSLYGVR